MAFGIIASIAGPVLGATIASGAAGEAASKQAAATDRATGISQSQFETTRSDQAPFRQAGVSAIQKLQDMLGLGTGFQSDPRYQQLYQQVHDQFDATHQQQYGMRLDDSPDAANLAKVKQNITDQATALFKQQYPDAAANANTGPDSSPLTRKFSLNDFWQDPVTQASYQSGLDLGTKALRNAAPLTTGLDSGAAMKELTKFGTDYTGQQAAGSQSRFVGDQNATYNKLMGLVNGGQVATQATGAAGAANAGNIGNLVTAGANASGAAGIAGANAWGGAMGNISNWWNQNQMIDKLQKGGFNGGGIANWATPNFAYTGYDRAGGPAYG